MESLKVIVAEDHPDSLEMLVKFINECPGFDVIETASDGEEFLYKTMLYKPDLVVVDINMPKLDGLSAIKECLKTIPYLKVIFVSGHQEYAVDAFEFQAVDYVVKPIKKTRLIRALDHAKQRIDINAINHTTNKNKKLYIRHDSTHYFIPKEDILFFEKVNHKVRVHTENRIYETQETLESYMQKLDKDFLRSHRSFIININLLESIKPSGNTFLAYFHNYDTPAFIAKKRLNSIKNTINSL